MMRDTFGGRQFSTVPMGLNRSLLPFIPINKLMGYYRVSLAGQNDLDK